METNIDTVKDMIEFLEKFPPDANIYVGAIFDGGEIMSYGKISSYQYSEYGGANVLFLSENN